jgi:hypothetical protein
MDIELITAYSVTALISWLVRLNRCANAPGAVLLFQEGPFLDPFLKFHCTSAAFCQTKVTYHYIGL